MVSTRIVESRCKKTFLFEYAKTKEHISYAVIFQRLCFTRGVQYIMATHS